MKLTTLTRRTLLRTALATTALAAPSVHLAYAAGNAAPSDNMVLAWHPSIGWLNPQQHYRGAPDNFLNAMRDALIKNFRDGSLQSPGTGRLLGQGRRVIGRKDLPPTLTSRYASRTCLPSKHGPCASRSSPKCASCAKVSPSSLNAIRRSRWSRCAPIWRRWWR